MASPRNTECFSYEDEKINVPFGCTDKFKAYDILPKEKHIVGKLYTQRIERENLTLRNRLKRLNRKTLGYSKSADMHDKVIRTFIEKILPLSKHQHIEYITHRLAVFDKADLPANKGSVC